MADTAHLGRERQLEGSSTPVVAGRALLSCLPMLVIAIVLIAAGGTRAGFIVPALVAGGVIGLLMFNTLNEEPERERVSSQR